MPEVHRTSSDSDLPGATVAFSKYAAFSFVSPLLLFFCFPSSLTNVAHYTCFLVLKVVFLSCVLHSSVLF